MTEPVPLTIPDVELIAERIKERQVRFNEDFVASVGIVLLNFGDRYVTVTCVNGEWSGVKGDLTPREGIPRCPDGHPLVETSLPPWLALVGDD